MTKPVFWNSIGIYLLLYNNILLIISLILAMKALIEGTAVFSSDVWYQISVFLIYLVVSASLFIGQKSGYIFSLLFIPCLIFLYFHPPMMANFFPKYLTLPFHLIEFISLIYLVCSPQSITYFRHCLKK